MAAIAAIFARRGPPYEVPLFKFLSMAIQQVPPALLEAPAACCVLKQEQTPAACSSKSRRLLRAQARALVS